MTKSPIKLMQIVTYDIKENIPDIIKNPKWREIESAIRRMDDFHFPIILLSCNMNYHKDVFEDEDAFNIIGGDGKFALFHMTGDWQYEREKGGSEEVRLWKSDQGYFCQERNILYDIDKVLKIVKEFYKIGSYKRLENFS